MRSVLTLRACDVLPPRHVPTMLLLLELLLAVSLVVAPHPPHIFLLYVDDWGWANTGFHRKTPSPEVRTPNIDAIVAGGIQLNRMYAYPFCAPSRAALMSGRMPCNSNHANIRGATYDGNHSEVGGQGVPRNQTVLSQMLAKAKYWSVFAGKWDIGFATQGHIPAGRGYVRSLHCRPNVRISSVIFYARAVARDSSSLLQEIRL